MNPKDKKFKKLQAKWYAKLAKDGFDDVEADEDHLKVWSSFEFINKFNPEVHRAKEEYYRAAGQFLHEHSFATDVERMIWEYHSNGVAIRTIVTLLADKKIVSHKRKVFETIKRLKAAMKEAWKTNT